MVWVRDAVCVHFVTENTTTLGVKLPWAHLIQFISKKKYQRKKKEKTYCVRLIVFLYY